MDNSCLTENDCGEYFLKPLFIEDIIFSAAESIQKNGTELEHEQLVKSVNKCELEKKEILLVEHLIGTEKRRDTFKQVYDW